MRQIPPDLQTHLEGGATTLCWCWRLRRRDGATLGFTDHDRDLAFDGTTFEAFAGMTATEMRESVGLNVDNLEVEGGITSERLAEADLISGLYDDARVELFRVNWQDTSQRVLMRTGSIGEVRRTGASFVAEIRGLAHYLQQPKGRLFQYNCDADLGDAACKVDLDDPAFRATATVLAVTGRRSITTADLAGFADGWFDGGLLTFTSGVNDGRGFMVKSHERGDAEARLQLWQSFVEAPLPGDTFTVTAGCDKTIETCRLKFANAINFRGFPHMPGNDFVSTIKGPSR